MQLLLPPHVELALYYVKMPRDRLWSGFVKTSYSKISEKYEINSEVVCTKDKKKKKEKPFLVMMPKYDLRQQLDT